MSNLPIDENTLEEHEENIKRSMELSKLEWFPQDVILEEDKEEFEELLKEEMAKAFSESGISPEEQFF